MPALGAAVVVEGRRQLQPLAAARHKLVDNFKADLKKSMILTGAKDVRNVSKAILYKSK